MPSGGSVWIYTVATDEPPSWETTGGAEKFRRIISWIEKVESTNSKAGSIDLDPQQLEKQWAVAAGAHAPEGTNSGAETFEVTGMDKPVVVGVWGNEAAKKRSRIMVFKCAVLKEVRCDEIE
ncbi:hypothetical protein RUND412_003050 [Rhizina undulata]